MLLCGVVNTYHSCLWREGAHLFNIATSLPICRVSSPRKPQCIFIEGVNIFSTVHVVQDREKCACWQLTIQGTAYGPGGVVDPTVGYYYRRLPEPVMTGIYECNSKYVLSCVHNHPFVPCLP